LYFQDDSSSVSSYLNEDMDGIDEVVQGLEKQKADEESSSRTRDVQLDKCFVLITRLPGDVGPVKKVL